MSCLRDSKIQENIKGAKSGSVITLPEGIYWLGDVENFSNELFMRPCYFELLEAKEEYFKLNDKLNTVVYTGTPGIGKSHLCAYVVAVTLLRGTVVYFERRASSETAEASKFYRLDLKNGASRLDSLIVLDLVPKSESAVYVVDGGPPTCWNPPLPTQIFASPSKALYRPIKKSWNYLYLHFSLFDLTEIRSRRSLITE